MGQFGLAAYSGARGTFEPGYGGSFGGSLVGPWKFEVSVAVARTEALRRLPHRKGLSDSFSGDSATAQ